MRISDTRWPVVRELARILLRTDELTVQGPVWLEQSVQNLALRLADVQPARTRFPQFNPGDQDAISMIVPETSDVLGRCCLDEPGIETVWLLMEPTEAWAAISTITDDLLRAGYPGCLGCGGPHTESAWDERASRQSMMNHRQDTS
ncbi:MAG: hypothetical protein VXA43_05015 [Candidatus Poseidoniales archaeon]